MSDTDLVVIQTLNPAQLAIINQKTPQEVIKKRPGRGGKTFSYVDHQYVTVNLNLAFAHQWSWEIENVWFLPNMENCKEVAVQGKLTVFLQNGLSISKTQFGGSDAKTDKSGAYLSLADDLKSASSDALKKAASLLGLAIDVYGSDYDADTGLPEEKHSSKSSGKPNWMPKALQWAIDQYYSVLTDEEHKRALVDMELFFEKWYKPSNKSEDTQKSEWAAYIKDPGVEKEYFK